MFTAYRHPLWASTQRWWLCCVYNVHHVYHTLFFLGGQQHKTHPATRDTPPEEGGGRGGALGRRMVREVENDRERLYTTVVYVHHHVSLTHIWYRVRMQATRGRHGCLRAVVSLPRTLQHHLPAARTILNIRSYRITLSLLSCGWLYIFQMSFVIKEWLITTKDAGDSNTETDRPFDFKRWTCK